MIFLTILFLSASFFSSPGTLDNITNIFDPIFDAIAPESLSPSTLIGVLWSLIAGGVITGVYPLINNRLSKFSKYQIEQCI